MSKHITNYKPKDFAELLNVSVKTLQRWDRDKILVAKRNPTGRRYYTFRVRFMGCVSIRKR